MDTIVWGPVVAQKSILFLIAAVAAAYGLLVLRLRLLEADKAFAAIVMNAMLIWIVCWKLSAVLFNGIGLLRQPASLLYFHGGIKGMALASLLAAAYIGWALRNKSGNVAVYIDSALVAVFGGYAAYQFLNAVWGEHGRLTPLLLALGAALLVLWWMRSRVALTARPLLARLGAAALCYALIFTFSAQLWDKTEVTAAGQAGLRIGQEAPDFELTLLDGTPHKLSDYRGKVVFINFWATWCPPCQAEMPFLKSFYEREQDSGVVILGVNATRTEVSVPVVKAWSESWALPFPIMLDKEGKVTETYKVNAYPVTFMLDREGRIRLKHQGPMDENMLREALQRVSGM